MVYDSMYSTYCLMTGQHGIIQKGVCVCACVCVCVLYIIIVTFEPVLMCSIHYLYAMIDFHIIIVC